MKNWIKHSRRLRYSFRSFEMPQGLAISVENHKTALRPVHATDSREADAEVRADAFNISHSFVPAFNCWPRTVPQQAGFALKHQFRAACSTVESTSGGHVLRSTLFPASSSVTRRRRTWTPSHAISLSDAHATTPVSTDVHRDGFVFKQCAIRYPIESAIEMSAACSGRRAGSSGVEVRDRFVDLLP